MRTRGHCALLSAPPSATHEGRRLSCRARLADSRPHARGSPCLRAVASPLRRRRRRAEPRGWSGPWGYDGCRNGWNGRNFGRKRQRNGWHRRGRPCGAGHDCSGQCLCAQSCSPLSHEPSHDSFSPLLPIHPPRVLPLHDSWDGLMVSAPRFFRATAAPLRAPCRRGAVIGWLRAFDQQNGRRPRAGAPRRRGLLIATGR